LPRIMFSNAAPSRYVIKKQPEAGCLSTLEATHELLVALERSGLDHYAMPEQLLGVFQRMQDFQLRCAADSARQGYRRHVLRPAAERTTTPKRIRPKRHRIFGPGAESGIAVGPEAEATKTS